jgi:hypothetical protein
LKHLGVVVDEFLASEAWPLCAAPRCSRASCRSLRSSYCFQHTFLNVERPGATLSDVDKRDWTSAFLAELVKLRPHLADSNGFPNRAAHALATTQYRPDGDPKVAARRYHAQQPAGGRR